MRCPNERCSYAFQWNPDAGAVAFACLSCKEQYCLNCDVAGGAGHVGPGHAPLSCEQQVEKQRTDAEAKRLFDEWKEQNAQADALFEKMVRDNGWKKCPHCSVAVERNGGCDHMTCRVCRCSFCYLCGKYDSSNPTSSRGCCGSRCSRRR
jgi:hypothetical protein